LTTWFPSLESIGDITERAIVQLETLFLKLDHCVRSCDWKTAITLERSLSNYIGTVSDLSVSAKDAPYSRVTLARRLVTLRSERYFREHDLMSAISELEKLAPQDEVDVFPKNIKDDRVIYAECCRLIIYLVLDF
jgi:hypothetical protein